MPTMLTLDDDVAQLLLSDTLRSGRTLAELANEYLRRELGVSRESLVTSYRVHPRPLRLPEDLTYDKVADLLEALDGVPGK